MASIQYHAWRPFILVSLALCIGTMGTALSSPLYPIYQQVWHLLPSDITYIFIAYMFGCLSTLLFLGRTSNSIGYIRTLQLGLLFAILGLIASVLAKDAYVLGLGRFIIGIASGLISTSAMLGLICTIPKSHQASAAQLSSIITVIGFSLGPFVGGSIAQFSTAPLVTPYLPIIVAAIISFLSLFSLKAIAFEKQKFSMAPHLQYPPPEHRGSFYLASFAAFCAFASFSLFASLAPSFIKEILPWHGPMLSGMTITAILVASVVAQILAKRIAMHYSLRLGLGLLLSSYVLLSLCMLMHWQLLFFVSVLFAGMGHGLSLIGAFAMIHHMTQVDNRAAVMATYLFIAYWGTILPIVAVGYISDHWGLSAGVMSFCLMLGLVSVFLLLYQARKLKPRE